MEQLIKAVLHWLAENGFSAVRRMPEGFFPELDDAVVAVGIEKAQTEEAGLYAYLGVMETDGTLVSLYGKRLEAEVSLEVVCPQAQGAKRCMQVADGILSKLSGGVKGLTIGKLTLSECRYERDAACFCCKVTAQTLAYVYALANEEETEFTDFMLKGEVQ